VAYLLGGRAVKLSVAGFAVELPINPAGGEAPRDDVADGGADRDDEPEGAVFVPALGLRRRLREAGILPWPSRRTRAEGGPARPGALRHIRLGYLAILEILAGLADLLGSRPGWYERGGSRRTKDFRVREPLNTADQAAVLVPIEADACRV